MTGVLLIAATIYLEGSICPQFEKHYIASTIWNNSLKDRTSLDATVKRKYRYSCWQNPKKLDSIDTESAAWRQCLELAKQLVSGQFQPSTRATHYLLKPENLWWRRHRYPLWPTSMQLDVEGRYHNFYYEKKSNSVMG